MLTYVYCLGTSWEKIEMVTESLLFRCQRNSLILFIVRLDLENIRLYYHYNIYRYSHSFSFK